MTLEAKLLMRVPSNQFMSGDCNTVVARGAVVTWSTQLHDELCRLAAAYLARHRPGETLQPSDLVHEAWLRLAATNQSWESRSHFFGAAGNAMRCVLIDQARHNATIRHGAHWTRVELAASELAVGAPNEHSQALDDALDQFTLQHPAESELVKLRFFDGLTLKEAATALGITHY